jgi:hypothetical protein
MSSTAGSPSGYDLFLSHATPDKAWVGVLRDELERLGLRAFLDERDLKPGEDFVLALSDGLRLSRFLVLVVTPHVAERPWIAREWTAFLAEHNAAPRLIPVLLEPAELPALLKPVQRLDATHRDAARVARDLAALVGRPGELPPGDARRLFIGQDLVFVLERDGENLAVTDPAGRRRAVTPPWLEGPHFTVARLGFNERTRQPVRSDVDRAELFDHATALGELLFGLLFDAQGVELLRQAMIPGQPRPLVTIRGADDVLLSLPWELLHHEGSFLVRDGRVDLARSIPGDVAPGGLLREPTGPLKLVINVSAPEGSGLDYEGESYRITRALTEHCTLTPTELGTFDDLVETVRRQRPTGIHFSGHGGPGRLIFEDDEGREAPVPVSELVLRLRGGVPDGLLPPFFYLASCHGNDPGAPEEGRPGPESLAARLHRDGVCQVVGYHGPIVDELSTRAEEALYAAIAEGHPTRHAVRLAREALARPLAAAHQVHREPSAAVLVGDTHPFAWAQLVFYHRGPDHPLSKPVSPGRRQRTEVLHRTFVDAGTRRVLATGFIGRRTELHRIRQRIRRGDRVFVFQGLGGLGKTTLAFHMLPLLGPPEARLTLWCQDAEKYSEGQDPIAEALVGQLLEDCRRRFGAAWE